MENEVVYLYKRTALGSQPVQPGTFHHPSALGRTVELNSVGAVFYYPWLLSARTRPSGLLESLCDVLGSYPPATGRLQRAPEGHWVVKCNDAGVRMVEARAEGSVRDWLRRADRAREKKLIFWEDMYGRPYFWSSFYVQMTSFEDGGLAIGVSCSQLLADAASLTMLVKAWSDVYLLGKILSPPDFRRLPAGTVGGDLPPRVGLIDHYKSAAEMEEQGEPSGPRSFETATLAFSDDMVRSIIHDAGAAGDGGAPTPFQALAALFWTTVSGVKGKRAELVDAAVCVDAREVLGLSKTFFGNAAALNGVDRSAAGGSGRLDAAARAIAAAMEALGSEDDVKELVRWAEADGGTGGPRKALSGPRLLCANWEGLRPYVATFEPGVRPLHVSYHLDPVAGEGQIVILPSSRGYEGSLSRVVTVTLPGDQLGTLCDDALILRYRPEILMGPKRAQL